MKIIRHELYSDCDKAIAAYREETKNDSYAECIKFLDWFFEIIDIDEKQQEELGLHPTFIHLNKDRFSEGPHDFTGKEVLDVYMKEVIQNADVKQPDKKWITAWLYTPVDEKGEREIQAHWQQTFE